MMILTVLEARVAEDRAGDLLAAYEVLKNEALPPGLVSSQLLRASTDPTLWRLETLWRDRQALEAMRTQGTPAGVLLFRKAGAEPALSIFDVAATIAGQRG